VVVKKGIGKGTGQPIPDLILILSKKIGYKIRELVGTAYFPRYNKYQITDFLSFFESVYQFPPVSTSSHKYKTNTFNDLNREPVDRNRFPCSGHTLKIKKGDRESCHP